VGAEGNAIVESVTKLVVLLVEDSEEDVFLFRRAVEKIGRLIRFEHVTSAVEAQQYLCGEGAFADRDKHPMPNIIFSDLNLHGLDGLSFLEWLRAQRDVRTIPCIIYSGSINPSDVHSAYSSGVTSFVVKPASFNEWVARLATIFKFWMDVAQPPPAVMQS
jgi:CheY-like chemotaxis protein